MEFLQRIDLFMYVCIEMMYWQNLIEISFRQNLNQDLYVFNLRQFKKIIMYVVYINIKKDGYRVLVLYKVNEIFFVFGLQILIIGMFGSWLLN